MVKKYSPQQKALIQTSLILLTLFGSVLGGLLWLSTVEDSELAQSLRKALGLRHTASETRPTVAPVVLNVPETQPELEAEPVEVVEPEPAPLPDMDFRAFCRQTALWPDSLRLQISKRVYIRYNGNVYGYMQFSSGMPLKVDALKPNGEVFGWIDGNYLSFSINETDFEEWFGATHGERYSLIPVQFEAVNSGIAARHRVGTPEGDAEFWADMRIWCDRNYDSIALEVQEDTLVFRWMPSEEASSVDYALEAREIARNFLMKRSARGSNENYAACEIRDPVTNQLLGASSIFIPRL